MMANKIKDININLDILDLYIRKMGWKKKPSTYDALNLYIEPVNDNPLDILLPKTTNLKGKERYIWDAVKTLSSISGEAQSSIIRKIKSIDRDLHNYRIRSYDDSVSLPIMASILDSTQKVIYDAVKLEQSEVYYELSPSKRINEKAPTKKAKSFIDKCRFPHTWNGSFGMTIEVPLELKTLGLLDEGYISETIGRKASYRMYRGLRLFNEAVDKGSKSYVIDNINSEKDVLFMSNFESMIEAIGYTELEFRLDLSPSIQNARYKEANNKPLKINAQTLAYIKDTVDQLQEPDDVKDIQFIGFPEAMRSDRESLLSEVEDGIRKVTVKGNSPDISASTLQVQLPLDDYRKALQAQDQIKFVSVRCRVKKARRGWDVTDLYSFKLVKEED